MTPAAARPPHRPPPAAILLIPVAVALVLTLFAWPSARLEPRDLPIGVAGAPVAAEAIEQSWLDVVGGNWAANAAALSLTVLAISSFVAGLWALLGELGLILAAL